MQVDKFVVERAGFHTEFRSQVQVRRGMDLVRVGNLGDTGIAFFYERVKMPPSPELLERVRAQIVPALKEVAEVFSYDARFVTLFHQPHAVSRFVRQKLLFNVWSSPETKQTQVNSRKRSSAQL